MSANKPTYILGLACFYHDSSACLLRDGELIAAAQEERFTRIKHDENFPAQAIKYCLAEAGIKVEDLDSVAFYEKPLWKFERLLLTYIREWPRGFVSFLKAMRQWLGKKLWMEHVIRKELGQLMNTDERKPQFKGKIYYVPHHVSHAASTYYPSGFDDATVLTIDGVGEWSTTTLGRGEGSSLTLEQEIVFPDSLGLLYSAFTYYLGFKVNSGEYKVMGLAPYGKAKYTDEIWQLVDRFDDGSFRLKPQYFSYRSGLRMTNAKFANHFGQPVRQPENELTQWHKDMAASLQKVTEELVLGLVNYAYTQHSGTNLCLSGGVALNCVANGRIVRESKFKNVYVFPAAGDAGGSVGAAFYAWHTMKTAKILLLTGTCGAGKTTVSEILETKGYTRITQDDVRRELFGENKLKPYAPEAAAQEVKVAEAMFKRAKTAFNKGSSVVLECILNEKNQPNTLLNKLEASDLNYEVKVLQPSLKVAQKRNQSRECWQVEEPRVEQLWNNQAKLTQFEQIDTSEQTSEQTAKQLLKNEQTKTEIKDIYWGPSFSNSSIKDFLQQHGVKFKEYADATQRADKTAEYLESNQVIGLFQGRMEFGPRALGNRSIIADPRQPENWKRVNLKIKFRESFRPFAPSVMADKADEIFDLGEIESPYMLLTAQTKAKDLPAITHVDGSARIQTVNTKQNTAYYDILKAFDAQTGCPVVINTSFNVRGEPIVCDYIDAFKCFLRTDMDVLVLENCIVETSGVDKEELKTKFELEDFDDD